jgi:hypothetical protein
MSQRYPYYQPYPYGYPNSSRRRKPARKAHAMTQAKYCPYCSNELPATLFDSSSHHKKPAERLFKVTPKLGWIGLLVIVVAMVVSSLPH